MTDKHPTPEDELLAAVIERCAAYPDVNVVRLDPARRNNRGVDNAGFPDLMLIGPAGIMFRELKTEDGKARGLRPAQTQWKHRLQAAGQDWAIWTPADLDDGRVDDELTALAEYDGDDINAEFARVMARDYRPTVEAAELDGQPDDAGNGDGSIVPWLLVVGAIVAAMIGINLR